MPDVDTSIYRVQPQQQQFNPLQALQMMDTATRLGSDLALGDIVRQSADPTSPNGINTNKLNTLIATDPRVARNALPIATAAQGLRQATTAADSADFQLKYAQNKAVADAIASVADSPSPQAMANAKAALARAGIPPDLIQWHFQQAGNTPQSRKQYATDMRTFVLGASGTSAPVQGPPTSEGAPQNITQGQFLRASGAPEPTGGVPSPGASGGGVVVGLPPGSEKSSAVMQDDLARARNFAQDMVPWQKALEKLQALGPGGTGPGSQGRQEFQSFLYAMSPTLARWLPGLDPQKLQDYAEAEKYLTQATQARAQTFGAGTDMQLATAITGNPNVKINQMANVDVVKMAMALRRAEQAQTMIASTVGGPRYTGEATRIATSLDPRAFAMDLYTPEQIDKLNKSLKGADRQKFNNSLRAAQSLNLVTRPDNGGQSVAARP